MGFFEWFSKPLQNQYADFAGRTSRQAFWMYTLVYVLLIIVISVIEEITLGTSIPSSLFMVAVLIPSIAITTRRLHDIGKSGWWQLIQFIPFLGLIVMIVFLVRESDRADNKYGPRPNQVPTIPPVATEAPQPQSPIPPASTSVPPSPTSSPVPQPPQNNQ